jgi:hypothetical protein
MRKLVLVSSILLSTWLALSLPSLAAEKPGTNKGGSTLFVGENKAAGSCYMNCGGGWEYIGEGSLEDCTCFCAWACGTGSCYGEDMGTGESGYCYVNQS